MDGSHTWCEIRWIRRSGNCTNRFIAQKCLNYKTRVTWNITVGHKPARIRVSSPVTISDKNHFHLSVVRKVQRKSIFCFLFGLQPKYVKHILRKYGTFLSRLSKWFVLNHVILLLYLQYLECVNGDIIVHNFGLLRRFRHLLKLTVGHPIFRLQAALNRFRNI